MEFLLIFLLGFYIGTKWERWMLLTFAKRLIARDQSKEQPKTCPHGYIDWDKCPDCCH